MSSLLFICVSDYCSQAISTMVVPVTRAVSNPINKMVPSPEKCVLWEEVNMCTADRASMLVDCVVDELHLILRGLNINEAGEKSGGKKCKKNRCFCTTVMGVRSFYKCKSKSLWLPN